MLHTTPDPGPFNTRYRRVLAPLPWQTMGVKAFFRLFLKRIFANIHGLERASEHCWVIFEQCNIQIS